MEQMLRWIIHQNFNDVDPRNNVTDFVTTRGTLQQILCSPYHFFPSDSWSICASKLKNTIYFALVETDEKVLQHAYLSERDKQMIAWGFKFEQYMTSNSSYGAPDMSSLTYQLEDFSIVLRSKLNEYSLLYKAEIDGLRSGASAGIPSNYIELKTSRNSPPYYSDISFLRSKSVKWWAQIFLAGVRDIVCGFRDNDGIVTSIETFSEAALTGYGKLNQLQELISGLVALTGL
ncbi:decapping and exoribonuclease protein-like [Uloborus diversus]|uniref:decapping and exoribonuclease protein-like n=1 Tax=Uloborus diversus TaxID=327109 RepID=UPI002409FCF3|nr:decapping and exoribonuclease protein-like [Uloborus diversus]